MLTSPKGRIVQRLFVHRLGAAGVLLIGGPEPVRNPRSLDQVHLRREDRLRDASAEWALRSALCGPGLEAGPADCGLRFSAPYGIAGDVGRRIGLDPRSRRLELRKASRSCPRRRIAGRSDGSSDARRVARTEGRAVGCRRWRPGAHPPGLPATGAELTEEAQPAGGRAVGGRLLHKGCYVGPGSRRAPATPTTRSPGSLLGLELARSAARVPSGPAPSAPVRRDGREVGRLTSVPPPPAPAAGRHGLRQKAWASADDGSCWARNAGIEGDSAETTASVPSFRPGSE